MNTEITTFDDGRYIIQVGTGTDEKDVAVSISMKLPFTPEGPELEGSLQTYANALMGKAAQEFAERYDPDCQPYDPFETLNKVYDAFTPDYLERPEVKDFVKKAREIIMFVDTHSF